MPDSDEITFKSITIRSCPYMPDGWVLVTTKLAYFVFNPKGEATRIPLGISWDKIECPNV